MVSLDVGRILCNREVGEASTRRDHPKRVRTLPSKSPGAFQALWVFSSLSSQQTLRSYTLGIGLTVQTSSLCWCWLRCQLTALPAESFLVSQAFIEHLLCARLWARPWGHKDE